MSTPLARRRLARVVTALALTLASTALVPATAAHAVTSSRYEADVYSYTNAERTKRSLVKVGANSCLDKFAERQAAAMAKQKRMFHQSLSPILSECRMSTVGENVAYGYTSGSAVVKGWMGSTGHRANILNTRFRAIGVGAAQDSNGRWYVAQVFGRAR